MLADDLAWSERRHHAFFGKDVLTAGLADPLEESPWFHTLDVSLLHHQTYICVHREGTHQCPTATCC